MCVFFFALLNFLRLFQTCLNSCAAFAKLNDMRNRCVSNGIGFNGVLLRLYFAFVTATVSVSVFLANGVVVGVVAATELLLNVVELLQSMLFVNAILALSSFNVRVVVVTLVELCLVWRKLLVCCSYEELTSPTVTATCTCPCFCFKLYFCVCVCVCACACLRIATLRALCCCCCCFFTATKQSE